MSLDKVLNGREDDLMEIFIQKGPEQLKAFLGVRTEEEWNLVFDYLVFRKNVLKRCVMQFLPFFKDLIREKGPLALRKTLGIEAPMYDEIFEQLFDLVALSHGALFEYVDDHRYDFVEKIKKGESKDLRKNLCLSSRKYSQTWEEIVELLCKSLNEQLVSEAMLERGLIAFNAFMNKVRFQRSLRTYKFF